MQLNRTQKKLQSNQASLTEHQRARNEIGNTNLSIIPLITNVPYLLMQNKLFSSKSVLFLSESTAGHCSWPADRNTTSPPHRLGKTDFLIGGKLYI